jgi:hypothetical protein
MAGAPFLMSIIYLARKKIFYLLLKNASKTKVI